jgi:hypothetical protein
MYDTAVVDEIATDQSTIYNAKGKTRTRQTARMYLKVCSNNIQWTSPLWIIDADVREWQRDNLATLKVKFPRFGGRTAQASSLTVHDVSIPRLSFYCGTGQPTPGTGHGSA